ncbi:MAG: hypothetical protein M3505_09235 [Verrucomicrobiota bacterium]|nr:hypothetical protein [Verrucomicrobiota bacterium]
MKRSPRPWEEQRKALLQSACNFVAEQLHEGMRLGRAIKAAATKFRDTDLGNGQRLKLSEKTLERFWYAWKRTKDPAILDLKYNAVADPLLLRLVVEHCLQSGESLSEAVTALKSKGARISIQEVYRAIPASAIDSFARSHKRLVTRRHRLEQKFLQSDARAHRKLLKQRAELQRRFLREDVRLRRQMLNQRERLQKRFLQADAGAVKRREQLQRRFFESQVGSGS